MLCWRGNRTLQMAGGVVGDERQSVVLLRATGTYIKQVWVIKIATLNLENLGSRDNQPAANQSRTIRQQFGTLQTILGLQL